MPASLIDTLMAARRRRNYYQLRREQRDPNVTCQVCGGSFYAETHRIKAGTAKFCSRECHHAAQASVSTEDRFWSHVERSDSCWLWTAQHDTDGYGKFTPITGRPSWGAHRVAWLLASGDAPSGRLVCHTCDTRDCVRNDDHGFYVVDGMEYERRGHLFLATPVANTRDMIGKGRHYLATQPDSAARGESSGSAKLTDEKVRMARKLHEEGLSGSQIGRLLGVHKTTIQAILNGKNWRHVS